MSNVIMTAYYLLGLMLAAAFANGASAIPLTYSDHPPPMQQIKDGDVTPEDIQCNTGLVHAVRANGAHVCVKETTAEKLGWEIFVIKAAKSDEATVDNTTEGENNGHVEALDYIWTYNITLKGIEKMPNPTGVWMPITREHAENTVMPRLAGAIGDSVILPASDTGDDYSDYDTTMGNAIRALQNPDHPDVIMRLDYYIYDNFSYVEQEEFLLDFMEGAGFKVDSVKTAPPNTWLDGHLITLSTSYLANFDGPYLLIRFLGWTNDPPPDGYMMSGKELEKRAYDFAVRNVHLFDDEWCTLKLYNEADIYRQHVHNGVLVYTASVGNCHGPRHSSSPTDQSVQIDAVTGEIAWFLDESFLIENWIDHIDIPESAKVRNNND